MNPLSPGTHTITIEGRAQRYHVHGSGPVCLMHSGGPGLSWEYMRMPAVEEHVTAVYVEPIGSPGADRLGKHPHGYSRARYALAIDGVIDHLGVDKVHLLGHSHGGFVAQFFATVRPERLAGVILYESAPVTGPEHFAEAQRLFGEFVRVNAGRPGMAEVVEAFQSLPRMADDEATVRVARGLFPAFCKDYWVREEEFAPIRAAVRGVFISGLDDNLAPVIVNDRETLGLITVPTLVIVGQHDFMCGPRWAHELHELIPGSRLVELADSGHFGHIEQAGEFASVVVDFVRANAAR
jgi:pimeloyl-ACP methyl ester carboxylesterase